MPSLQVRHLLPKPIPDGFELRRTKLQGHGGALGRIAWSPDGGTLATPSFDRGIRLWCPETSALKVTLGGHHDVVWSVSWSPDGKYLASASNDGSVILWDAGGGRLYTLDNRPGAPHAYSVAWSPDGRFLATGWYDGSVVLWEWDRQHAPREFACLRKHVRGVNCLVWLDAHVLASGSNDSSIILWDAANRREPQTLSGHFEGVNDLAWCPASRLLASCSADPTSPIRLWSVSKTLAVDAPHELRGPAQSVKSVRYSCDGKFLAAKSLDGTVTLWRCDMRQRVAVLVEPTSEEAWQAGVAFHPSNPAQLATLDNNDRIVRLWDLDCGVLLDSAKAETSAKYANAKVVLLGNSGVGKTALGLVLSGEKYRPVDSTHERFIRVLDKRDVELPDATRVTREVLLWDLAGQPGYRLIHQLHLHEVDVALVVIDAQSNDTDGVMHWTRALRQAERLARAPGKVRQILVHARLDGGRVSYSPADMRKRATDWGFRDYFETSASEDKGIAPLKAAILAAVDWARIPDVSSPELFRRITAFLMAYRGEMPPTDSGIWPDPKAQPVGAVRILTTRDDAYQEFLKSDGAAQVLQPGDLREQFDLCLRRAATLGLIQPLSFGGLLLLKPEVLDGYVCAMIEAAKSQPDGLGSLSEEDARTGNFPIPLRAKIDDARVERQLLHATIEELISHELAFREPTATGRQLIFPSQLTRAHPSYPEPQDKDETFDFEGAVLDVYTRLVVRLWHSGGYASKEMYRNAVLFRANEGGVCGMFLKEFKEDEGRGELLLFYQEAPAEPTRGRFSEFIHEHLAERAIPESVRRTATPRCPRCRIQFSKEQIQGRLDKGHNFMKECPICEDGIPIPIDGISATGKGGTTADDVLKMRQAADAQRELERGLVSASAEMGTDSFLRWVGRNRATLAIVFTDIVGFTSLDVELGEAMDSVWRAHCVAARALVKRLGGYEIRTIGDAFMVAFKTALEALEFSTALHKSTGHARVRIRAGIHVGPVRIDEDDDARGNMIAYAARIVAACSGADVWASSEVKQHVESEQPGRHAWQQKEATFKGFAGPQTLWALHLDSPTNPAGG